MGLGFGARGRPFRIDDLFTGAGSSLMEALDEYCDQLLSRFEKYGHDLKQSHIFASLKIHEKLPESLGAISEETDMNFDLLITSPPYSPSEDEDELITRMLPGEHWEIIKIYTRGLSLARLVAISRDDATGSLLPIVAKIGPTLLILDEVRRYRLIKQILHKTIELLYEPVVSDDGELAAVGFALSGAQLDTIKSLHDIFYEIDNSRCTPEEQSARVKTVLKNSIPPTAKMLWVKNILKMHFNFSASYDWLVLPNYRIEQLDAKDVLPSMVKFSIAEDSKFDPHDIKKGDVGEVVNLPIIGISKAGDRNRLLVNFPSNPEQLPSKSFRVELDVPNDKDYKVGETVPYFVGRIVANRGDLIQEELQHIPIVKRVKFTKDKVFLNLEGQSIQRVNPLTQLAKILNSQIPVRVALIHGDYVPGNILINELDSLENIIDFAYTRWDHVLHDPVKLELMILIDFLAGKLTSENWSMGDTFYRTLHLLLTRGEDRRSELPADVRWLFDAIMVVRRLAVPYLYNISDFKEYYHSLLIYCLGVLKFQKVKPTIKLIVFLVACTIAEFLSEESTFPTHHLLAFQ